MSRSVEPAWPNGHENGLLMQRREGQMRNVCLVILVFLLGGGIAAAQTQKNEDLVDDVQPPNFGPLGDPVCCSSPGTPIPGNITISDTLLCDVGDNTLDGDLGVILQINHTWVGDLSVRLTHDDTGTTALIMDRPGKPNSGFGCSGDDIDAQLFDAACGGSVEDQCAGAVSTINGEFTPDPDALAVFDGESHSGSWTLTVTDHAGADSGFLNTWCVDKKQVGGDGDCDVPATGTWEVIVLLGLLMVGSLFFMRRRADV